MKFKKVFEKYEVIFSLFVIGSFLGFLLENIYTILRKGQFILRTGLIYSPLIPVYGIGVLIFYFIYNNLKFKKENKIIQIFTIFIIGFALGGMVEYLCSYFQENIFGTISWSYDKLKFNLNGRISLFHNFCWGLLGIVFYQIILPFFKKKSICLKTKPAKIIIVILSIFLLFDCFISYIACIRQTERREGIAAQNKVDRFLDSNYPDDYLNQIYTNARATKKVKHH